MSLLVIGAVRGFGIVTPVVSVSAETSIAEGGAISQVIPILSNFCGVCLMEWSWFLSVC
jgi:hypothetical protein